MSEKLPYVVLEFVGCEVQKKKKNEGFNGDGDDDDHADHAGCE